MGDFYASGLDQARLAELGLRPLRPELDRIAAIDGKRSPSEALGRLMVVTNDAFFLCLTVSSDPRDRSRYALFAMDGPLPPGTDSYLAPGAERIRAGHVKRVEADLVLAWASPEAVRRIEAQVLDIETRIAREKLGPVDRKDPAKRLSRTSLRDLRALLSNVDLDAHAQGAGLVLPDELVVAEVEAFRERNSTLGDLPLETSKALLRWELLRRMGPYLSPSVDGTAMAFARVLSGPIAAPPRPRAVGAQAAKLLGRPLSQLYVAKHFPAEAKRQVEEMVGHVKAVFRTRLEGNRWLSDETRRHALEKLSRVEIRVGSPAVWGDQTAIDIRRDDSLGNVLGINEWSVRRDLARPGQKVTKDTFSVPGSTRPIDVNAACAADDSDIEIPAAFLQPRSATTPPTRPSTSAPWARSSATSRPTASTPRGGCTTRTATSATGGPRPAAAASRRRRRSWPRRTTPSRCSPASTSTGGWR